MAAFEKYRSVYTHDELMEHLRRIRHVALDMDGTIYMGMSLFPYTKPFLAGLKEMGIGYSFLTNNPVEVRSPTTCTNSTCWAYGRHATRCTPPHWRRSTTSGSITLRPNGFSCSARRA